MALTYGVVERISFGNKLGRMIPITFDSSYPSGGYTGVGQVVTGLLKVQWADMMPLYDGVAQPAHAFIAVYDIASALIRVFGMAVAAGQATPLLEVTAATNLSAYTSRLLVIGY